VTIRVLNVLAHLSHGGAQLTAIRTGNLLQGEDFQCAFAIGVGDQDGALVTTLEKSDHKVIQMPTLKRTISFVSDLRALFSLVQILRSGRFDIVHSHGAKAGVLVRIASVFCPKVGAVHTVHGWNFYDDQRRLKKILIIMLERLCFLIGGTHSVVTDADAKKAEYHAIARASEFRLIRGGIDLNPYFAVRGKRKAGRKALGLRSDLKVVGSVMRLCPEKAPDEYLRVADQVLQARLDVVFVLVGGGPLEVLVREKIASMGWGKRLLYLGERRDIPIVLSSFDIFLISSRTEGLPRTVLESLAANIPVVATDVGGIYEVVTPGENGYLCQPSNTRCLTDSITKLLDNPLITQTDKPLTPLSVLEAFSEERMAADWIRCYRDVYHSIK